MAGSLPHRALRDLAKKYGPLMHLQLGEVSTVVVSSPELAKEVLRTHDINFASRPEILAIKILFYNCTDIAFSPYGEYFTQLRKICMQELFSVKKVQTFQWLRKEESLRLMGWIASKAGSPINLTQQLSALTYSTISRAAFGKTCRAHERFLEVAREAIYLADGFKLADIFPSFTFLHSISGTTAKLEKMHRETDTILENIIAEHREAARNTNRISEASEDVIDVLLKFENRDDQGFCLSTSNIKAVIFDLFAGGGESAAATLDWTVAEMIKHPRILEKAQAEVRQVFDESQGEVREEGLEKLQYMKSVLKETLRLHTPAPLLLPRVAAERCEINGFDIPKKARVIVNAWAIGRDPAYWKEPETFNPDRFLGNPIEFLGNSFEYIPFGAGRRICPGMNFGLATLEYQLAMLLYHFDWKLPHGLKNEDVDMTELFGPAVKRKHDLYLIPTPYRPSQSNKHD
ncbi:hypothetical protein CDL15_Pgr026795 [Punica granatum]|nr:hypothetical protein CDL15_Pgr026795 [Punica granatum]